MGKINIKIVLIGIPIEKVDCRYLSKWNSILFKIDKEALLFSNLSNLSHLGFDGIHLSNILISGILENNVIPCDLIIGITDRKLDGDWFTQRITDKSFIISFFGFEDELRMSEIPLENFILRFIYPFCLIYLNNNNRIPEQEKTLIHPDSQRCIFDFMKYKSDVMVTLIKPKISAHSKANFTVACPSGFLENIEKELQKLNVNLFYRIKKWIKRKPILAILISGLFALIINIIAAFIYGFICNLAH